MALENENAPTANAYSKAIYEIALESWQKGLQDIHDKLSTSPDLVTELDDTQKSFKVRQEQLNQIIPKSLAQPVCNFLYELMKNGHLHLLDRVLRNLSRLVTKGPNVQVVEITSAVPLTKSEKEQFRTKLSTKYGDNLDFEFKVDQSIIGGVIVQIGDMIMDGSISRKLGAMEELLT
ncbi:MAG: ATP synthase F1 subunit delta [Anaerolineaceae bacterium 4572_78]|nr:MAG: ATP synthase F1 subunit delta [Anaerolineaceae bacterium 4572_78]